MTTEKLIRALRDLAKIGIVNYRQVDILTEAADQLENLDERVSIMAAEMDNKWMEGVKEFGWVVNLSSVIPLDEQRKIVEEHAREKFGSVLMDAGAVGIHPPMLPGTGYMNQWGVKIKVIMPSISNDQMYAAAKAMAFSPDDYDEKKHSGLMEE